MKARFKQALCILFGTMLICTAQVAAYTEDSTEYCRNHEGAFEQYPHPSGRAESCLADPRAP